MSEPIADQSDAASADDVTPEEAAFISSSSSRRGPRTSLRELLKLRAPAGQQDNMPHQQQQPHFLLALHAVTCGRQGPELGCDEAPICQLGYLVYDVQRRKVVVTAELPVKPLVPPGRTAAAAADEAAVSTVATREEGRVAVSDECREATGVTEDSLDSAASLADCLAELDRALVRAGVHPDTSGRRLCLATDGQATLRLLLHPEAASKRLRLPAYFYRFCDLRKAFHSTYDGQLLDQAESSAAAAASVADMLTFLGLQQQQQQETQPGHCASHCLAMSRVIGCLLADGHQFCQPETVTETYLPALVRQSDPVGAETVARARGLPWQAGDAEVAGFFAGLNVSPGGVALALSRAGRRSGEALLRFDSAEQRDLALLRHRHHLGRRYVEVFKAAARDFLAVAAVRTPEAEQLLARVQRPGQQLVRMRGLPYAVTAEQVLDFFAQSGGSRVQFGQAGLLFAQRPDGRPTGDAFVLFESEAAAEGALARGHRQHIGSRYVELFKSTPAELNQVLGEFLRCCRREPSPLVAGVSSGRQQQQQQQPQHHLVRISGMPPGATVADIVAFLDVHSSGIAFQGVHQVLSHLGQPTGEAVIEMVSERAAQLACAAKAGRPFPLGRCGGGGGLAVPVEVGRCLPQEVPPPSPPPLQPPLPHQQQFPVQLAALHQPSQLLALPASPYFAACLLQQQQPQPPALCIPQWPSGLATQPVAAV